MRRTLALEDKVRGVTALIVDCSYTREEYPAKRGWGHGTFDSAFDMAIKAGARQLYCTHHEPTRSDDELEAVFAEVMARRAPLPEGLQVVLAYEGLEVTLEHSAIQSWQDPADAVMVNRMRSLLSASCLLTLYIDPGAMGRTNAFAAPVFAAFLVYSLALDYSRARRWARA
eukprot:gene30633-31185_t